MGIFPSWGTSIAPPDYLDQVKKREHERRMVNGTQQASDDDIATVMGLSALAAYPRHIAGAAAAVGDTNSDNYQQSPTNTDNGSID